MLSPRGAAMLSNAVYTDRCKFHFENPGCVVKPVTYGFEGEPRRITKVNHPKVLNVYAGISKYGVTDMIEVAGTTGRKSEYFNKKHAESRNITSAEYKDVLSKGLLPSALKKFRNQGKSFFCFLQDNDPTHLVASDVIGSFNQQNACNITLLKPPPNSPDLNPIENVWGWVKNRADRRGCTNFEQYKVAVRDEFKRIPKRHLENLVGSMQNRLRECQRLNGQRTRY
jgi:hypothetical protein